MREIYSTLGVLLLLVFIQACSKSTFEEWEEEIIPIVETVNYDSDVAPILLIHCSACHSGVDPVGVLDLSTFANVQFYTENGPLLNRISSVTNPMPPSGLMSANDIAVIEKWVADGYLEN